MIQESARTGIVQKDKETVALIPEIKFGLMARYFRRCSRCGCRKAEKEKDPRYLA